MSIQKNILITPVEDLVNQPEEEISVEDPVNQPEEEISVELVSPTIEFTQFDLIFEAI